MCTCCEQTLYDGDTATTTEGHIMNVRREITIKTYRNADGTYDASVNGKRLGLRSSFWFTARAVALRAAVVMVEKKYDGATRFDVWTHRWVDVTIGEFVQEIARSIVTGITGTRWVHESARWETWEMEVNGIGCERWMLRRKK